MKTQSWRDGASRYVAARSLRFLVADVGAGPPVLLLHGFPDTLDLWREVAPRLVAAGHRVIAFDQRGCGDSDMPAALSAYAIAEIVDDAIALLDALGITTPVDVMGHDWGAVIAWGMALRHPARVRKLVAVGVGHPQAYGRAGFEQKFVKGLYVLGFQFRGLAEWVMLRGGGLRRWLQRHPDMDEIERRMARPGRLTAALNWYRANLMPVLFRAWPRCTRPVLGIIGSDDKYLTAGQMSGSARYMDAAWAFRRFDGCGHWIPLEQPAALADAACAWFDGP